MGSSLDRKERSRHVCDYVEQGYIQHAHMKLLLEMYSADTNVALGSRILLEVNTAMRTSEL